MGVATGFRWDDSDQVAYVGFPHTLGNVADASDQPNILPLDRKKSILQ
jgi:hypothetical protein